MSTAFDGQRFAKALFDIPDETFENHHGIFLDRNTSLFATLEAVTAADPQRPSTHPLRPLTALGMRRRGETLRGTCGGYPSASTPALAGGARVRVRIGSGTSRISYGVNLERNRWTGVDNGIYRRQRTKP